MTTGDPHFAYQPFESTKGASALTDAGHDTVWAGAWIEHPGDDEILAQATREGRVLVTLDKDFGELAVVRGMRHCGLI